MIPIAKPYLTEEEAQSAYDTVLSGWVMQGPNVLEFEQKICEYTGAEFAVATSNCTTALHLSMISAGIEEGDEVICPSFSFIATANCIKYVGAKPVFADVYADTLNMNPHHAESLITDKTKAVLIVHQLGMPADIDEFRVICDKYELMLIEDAACAIGSTYKGEKIGTHSDLVCFSFHPRKVITTGEGGVVTTNNRYHYERLQRLRQHLHVSGNEKDISHPGYNYRMTDIQAGIGLKQLYKIDLIVKERRRIAASYIDELKNVDCLKLQIEKEGYCSNYQSFNIILKYNSPVTRDELMNRLYDEGISSVKGIECIHKSEAYKNEYGSTVLPVSEEISGRSLMIPLFVPMEEKDIKHILKVLKANLSA